jgi:hypothetical protein
MYTTHALILYNHTGQGLGYKATSDRDYIICFPKSTKRTLEFHCRIANKVLFIVSVRSAMEYDYCKMFKEILLTKQSTYLAECIASEQPRMNSKVT